MLNSPLPAEPLSASNPSSISPGSNIALVTRSPLDLNSAFAAHSSQTDSLAQSFTQPDGQATTEPANGVGTSSQGGKAKDSSPLAPAFQSSPGTKAAADQFIADVLYAPSQVYKAVDSSDFSATQARGGQRDSSGLNAQQSRDSGDGSSPQSTSSSTKENRPAANVNSIDRAHSLGSPLTVKIKAADNISHHDYASAVTAGTSVLNPEADEEAEHAQDSADASEDDFAAHTDETLTASQASESGLSRQGSMSGLSSFPPTPTSRMSEVSMHSDHALSASHCCSSWLPGLYL